MVRNLRVRTGRGGGKGTSRASIRLYLDLLAVRK